MNPFPPSRWLVAAIVMSLATACVPSARYHAVEQSNQEAQKKIRELSLRAERADSLTRELEASQKALFKTERTLADFYIEYRIREEIGANTAADSLTTSMPAQEKKDTRSAGTRKQSDSLQFYKTLAAENAQKLKTMERSLQQKTDELAETKKRYLARDEVFDTQEKRLSDFFTALYRQRVAYDSLQAEYYALYKSKDQKNQSSKIDPQETHKLKRTLASRDSLIYLNQRSLEQKEYRIKSLEALADSLRTASQNSSSHEKAEKLQLENQALASELQVLQDKNRQLSLNIDQKDQNLESKNQEIASLKSELSTLLNEKKEKKSESADLKKSKAENEKLNESLRKKTAELDSALSRMQILKDAHSGLSTKNEKLSLELRTVQSDLEKMKTEMAGFREAGNRQNNQISELQQLKDQNASMRTEIQGLKNQQDSLQRQNKMMPDPVRTEKKLDSLHLLLKEKSELLAIRDREIKTMQVRLDELSAKAKSEPAPAAKPIPAPAGLSKLQEQLKKLTSDPVVIQNEPTGAVLEIPQSALFTQDLITLTQKGSELIIRICQTIQSVPARQLEILSVQNANQNKNEQLEIQYGRAKTIGKLMNIYGVKSDAFSFGLAPGGNAENIRIRIHVK
jgi:hypothetical protein